MSSLLATLLAAALSCASPLARFARASRSEAFRASACRRADPSIPHIHNGALEPFKAGQPPKPSGAEEAQLNAGKTVMKSIRLPGQGGRAMAIFDVPAPPEIVWDCINDVKSYPKMVSGVDSCVTYADATQGGLQVVKSEYEISALHMRFKYYVKHTFDPAQRCMVFHLDYDRRSDLDDTVGYWYVDPRGRAVCRVYYSCECKLRGWVPGPVYNMLTKEAVKKVRDARSACRCRPLPPRRSTRTAQ